MRKLLLILALATPAFAKSLDWDALNVTARLDGEGVLHVVERQAMVFDGDWNGGERTFRVRLTQKLRLEGIARVGDDGQTAPLVRGDLSKVDHYDFTSGNVVRWRSRLPSDPPFENRRIVYVLTYALENVLEKTAGRYRLDHDFAFPNRQGTIRKFTLDLTFDPAWNATPIHIEQQNVAPGQSVVVTRDLTYSGAGQPAAFVAAPRWLAPLSGAVMIAAMLLLIALFFRSEQPTGRFAPPSSATEIDEAWLRMHVLSIRPEAAGAAWDGRTGPPEVAAVLARLTSEGKITSKVNGKTLSMHLNQALNTFSGYEHALLAAMFFDGSDTDTTRIRKHYANKGFDPSGLIRGGVEKQMKHERGKKVKRFDWSILIVIGVVALATTIVALIHGKIDLAVTAVAGGLTLFFTGFGAAAAYYNARALTGIGWRALVVALVFSPAVIAVVVAALLARTNGIGEATIAGLTLLVIVCWKLVLNAMKITDAPSFIAYRKQMIGARDYFAAQLRSPQPQLRDEWLPYLLAFGLGTNVDRWFRSFGGRGVAVSATAFGSHSSGSSSSSTGTSSSPWTGGGGAFGGAGATGTWVAAAGTLASGVAAPSSGGSGGGGGGGSSGGGGGGGW